MYVIEDTDSKLFDGLRKGSEAAFKILYERYWAELYTMTYRRLKDEEAAKDIVQNIFINLWTSRKEIFIDRTLAPYLNRAARNKTISFYKKNLADMTREAAFHQEQGLHTHEANLEAKELETIINDEISQMSEVMRQVFILSRQENKSIKEIAFALSLSEQTVKNNISLALHRLRKKTKQFYAEPVNLIGIFLLLLT